MLASTSNVCLTKKFPSHLNNSKSSGTCKLFVGNLATQTTSAHLQTIFHSHGHVIECVKVRERYGFVRFSSSDEAQRALNACNGLQLNGYPMIVEYAQNEILISPKSPRLQTNCSRKNAPTPIFNRRRIVDNPMGNSRSMVNKKYLSSNLNPDASSFQFACSTSDYYSQSDRPSSRSNGSSSSSSGFSVRFPLAFVSDDDDHEHEADDEDEEDDDEDEDDIRLPSPSDQQSNNDDQRSCFNLFIGDQILNLYGSNMNSCKYFNGRDVDPRDPIFIWNFAFYPDVSMNPFVKRNDIKTLLERRVSLYSQC